MLGVWSWNLCYTLVIYYSGCGHIQATCLTFVGLKFDCKLAHSTGAFEWDEDTEQTISA